jgi:hypothetical protein
MLKIYNKKMGEFQFRWVEEKTQYENKSYVFLDAGKAREDGTIDWANKASFKLGSNDLATVLVGIDNGSYPITLIHKTEIKTSTLKISLGQKEGTYGLSLENTNNQKAMLYCNEVDLMKLKVMFNECLRLCLL